jgi:hypothetical protein
MGKDKISSSIDKMIKALSALPKKAEIVFKAHTPIDKGYARRNTRLVGGNKIVANYKYASLLDEGRSKQSPDGMVNPTKKFLDAEIKRIMRK